MQDEILTIAELEAYLKIPKQTLYKLAQQGRIPAVKVGRHWRFRKAEVERWMASEERRVNEGRGTSAH